MNWRKNIWIFVIAISFVGVSCNRGAGCEATDFANKRVDINNDKQASFKQSKKKNVAKSSVMPAEIKVKKKK